jgi:hypothetical protein
MTRDPDRRLFAARLEAGAEHRVNIVTGVLRKRLIFANVRAIEKRLRTRATPRAPY